MKKEKSIKLSKYFEVIKPKYVYLKIVPDKSIRNYNTSNIAEAITHIYKSINKKIKIETKRLSNNIPIPVKATLEQNYHVNYIIDITKNDVSFYFYCPCDFKNILIEKINEIWDKATILEIDNIEGFKEDSLCYQLSYKKEDSLSLSVDKKSNEPLNSLLSVINIMKEDDRVSIVYNFIPRSQKGWSNKCELVMKDFLSNKPLVREKLSFEYLTKSTFSFILSILDTTSEVIADFLGANKKNNESLVEALATFLEEDTVKELTPATKKKKKSRVLDNQIAVISHSNDETRKNNNIISVCQSYQVLNGNNELVYKKTKSIPNLNIPVFKNYDINTISTDEAQNFIQIPARSLLKHYNINHIEANQNLVPNELRNGYFDLGNVTYKGETVKAYLEDEYNSGNFPLLLLGPQGMGKTTYMTNITRYANSRKEGALILDFIKKNEMSDSICAAIPKEDRIVLDLSKEQDLQGFGYNEIEIKENMSDYEKVKAANLKAQYTINFIDAINYNEPLTINMRSVLNACCNIVFSLGYTSIKEVVQCLTNHTKRHKYINSLTPSLKELLSDEIEDLKYIDEYDKKGIEVVGTKSSKSEFLMARIGLLKEDFKLKFMYNKSTKNNLNLFKAMEEGKIVIIKMPQSEFPSLMAKNVLVTYWATKMWAVTEMRGSLYEKPNRTHLIIDEPFQAPTVLKLLEYQLPQSRKFGLKTILSTQTLSQLGDTFNILNASNSSYMLLKNTGKKDFELLKQFTDYEYEDLAEIKRFDSLNIITYSGGYASFISKLPEEIKKQ